MQGLAALGAYLDNTLGMYIDVYIENIMMFSMCALPTTPLVLHFYCFYSGGRTGRKEFHGCHLVLQMIKRSVNSYKAFLWGHRNIWGRYVEFPSTRSHLLPKNETIGPGVFLKHLCQYLHIQNSRVHTPGSRFTRLGGVLTAHALTPVH